MLSSQAMPETQLKTPENGAEFLIWALCRNGVDSVFGYPGGAIMPVYDALNRYPIRHILTRHEQSAAFAADGWGRVRGTPGVCLATSGPGATNLVTGLADAHMDSVPLIAITGQVSNQLMGTDAFQYVDIFGLTMPIVKHSFLVREIEQLPEVIEQAFEICQSGRPGPVLIDLPKDIQQARAPLPRLSSVEDCPANPVDSEAVVEASVMLEQSQRPLLYVGGGVALADAVDELRTFQSRHALPAVATLKGLGCLDADDPLFLGMLGMHGSRAANTAVAECDLLICIGARFDDRATGTLNTFAPDAKVIHMDRDKAEIGKLREVDCALHGRLDLILRSIRLDWTCKPTWQQRCRNLHQDSRPDYDAPGLDIYAPALLRELSQQDDDMVICCDVGQHQMWVAQHCRFNHPRNHLTSGGLGAMGFGLPAAIGAKLARPEATVVVVTGDGSIMMNIQELATLSRYGIDVKVVLLDNSCLGLVRQWQELFFNENYSEIDLSDNPDFSKLAETFGVEAFGLDQRSEVSGGIRRLLDSPGPALMHVKINPETNVWPLVPPGKANTEMLENAP